MNPVPELSDDAIIDVAREGGFAYIPKLATPRRFTLSQLSAPLREHVCNVLHQALPLGKPSGEKSRVGYGDQYYFRIEIHYATQRQVGNIVIVIPEDQAPPELVQLWQNGH